MWSLIVAVLFLHVALVPGSIPILLNRLRAASRVPSLALAAWAWATLVPWFGTGARRTRTWPWSLLHLVRAPGLWLVTWLGSRFGSWLGAALAPRLGLALGSWRCPGSTTATTSASTVLHQPNPTSIQFRIVQLLHCSLQIRVTGKLHNSFVSTLLVSIRIGDLTSLAHVVLQVLWGRTN